MDFLTLPKNLEQKTFEVIKPNGTAAGLSESTRHPPGQWVIRVTGGGAAEPAPGEVITTSAGGSGKVRGVVSDVNSKWASGSAIAAIYLDEVTGTWTVGSSVNYSSAATLADGPTDITAGAYNRDAEAVIIHVGTSTVNFLTDGNTPTNDSNNSIGHPVAPGDDICLYGSNNIRNFKAIEATSGSAAVLFATGWF